jgi:HAD superfamily hydrolase (TIGR01490 family)
MHIAMFDLDHTLLDGDTNVLWIDHLTRQKVLEPSFSVRQAEFMAQYAREMLDMTEYMAFHLGIFRQRSMSAWQPVIDDFVHRQLIPRMTQDAFAALKAHRTAGHTMAIVTATNSVLAGALGAALGLHTISTDIEIIDDRATGRTVGTPPFRKHKINRVQQWLGMELNHRNITTSYFYSDSANDLPILQAVSHPIVVNADSTLRTVANERGWPQLEWTHRSR